MYGSIYLFAIKQRIFWLHADELGPPVDLSDMIQVLELEGVHRASTYVTDFTLLNEVVERLHDLFRRDGRIQPMDLEKINVWSIEPFERGIDLIEDSRTRQPGLIDIVALTVDAWDHEGLCTDILGDKTIDFGHDHHIPTRDRELEKT